MTSYTYVTARPDGFSGRSSLYPEGRDRHAPTNRGLRPQKARAGDDMQGACDDILFMWHCEAPPFGAEAVSTLREEIATPPQTGGSR